MEKFNLDMPSSASEQQSPNIMYFDSDDDFYQFCVVPLVVICDRVNKRTGDTIHYMDFDLSHQYHKAVEDGVTFIIKDEDSQICKHGCVSYRTISKTIDNLEPYYKMIDKKCKKKYITT